MTMTHNVTLAWEEAFRDGTGEEDSGQQEGDDVESVERKRGLLCPGDGDQAVGYGADVQQVC